MLQNYLAQTTLFSLPPAAVVISLEAFHTTDTRHTHTRTTHSYVYI